MGKERLITLINDYDNAFEANLICSFELPIFATMYITYTKNEKDLNGNSIIYCAKVISQNEKQYLTNIDNFLEWEQVKEKLKEMAKYSYEIDSDNKKFENKISIAKSLEVPKNIFSNLDDFKISNEDEKEPLNQPEETKINPLINREYREKIKKLYDQLGNIQPSDHNVEDVLYFDTYLERGIVIKSSISSLKQLWEEYCTIYKEYHHKATSNRQKKSDSSPIIIGVEDFNKNIIKSKTGSNDNFKDNNEVEANFDELFSSLSQRVNSINEYIDELKELQDDIDNSSNLLESEKNGIQQEKDKLKQEKEAFEKYKISEQEKLTKKRQELQLRVNKFQVLVEQLDKKFQEVE